MMYRLLVFIPIFLFFSCKKNETQQPVNYSSETINNIETNVKMVNIKGGLYKPFFGIDTILIDVADFMIDESPVTNSDFLIFVKANPQWQRSNVKRIYADSNYLKGWQNDTTLPLNANPNAPICDVSWFAAKAYAKSVSKRLPTLDEWEYVAMANETMPNARKEKSYSDAIVALYLIKDRQYNAIKQSPANYWGVYNMFDLVWEWIDDFNSVLTTGDSREASYDNKGLFCAGGATSATDILNYAAFMRYGLRSSLKANYTVSNLGFRCAKSEPNNE